LDRVIGEVALHAPDVLGDLLDRAVREDGPRGMGVGHWGAHPTPIEVACNSSGEARVVSSRALDGREPPSFYSATMITASRTKASAMITARIDPALRAKVTASFRLESAPGSADRRPVVRAGSALVRAGGRLLAVQDDAFEVVWIDPATRSIDRVERL